MKFYVYVYSDPANDTPFYVGMGKGNRKFAHLREAKNNPEPVQGQHKLNTIRKMIREGRNPLESPDWLTWRQAIATSAL